jgi:hypothetical protein
MVLLRISEEWDLSSDGIHLTLLLFYPGGFRELRLSECCDQNLPSLSRGMLRITAPARSERTPRITEYAHWAPVSRVMAKACPPVNMMIIWAPTIIKLTPMKSQLRCIPSNIFNPLSIRRQLLKVSIECRSDPEYLQHTSTG